MSKTRVFLAFFAFSSLALAQTDALEIKEVTSAGSACPASEKTVVASLSEQNSLKVELPPIDLGAVKAPGFKRLLCQFIVQVRLPKNKKYRTSRVKIPLAGRREAKTVVSFKHHLQAKAQTATAEYSVNQEEHKNKELDLVLRGEWTECHRETATMVFNLSIQSMAVKKGSALLINRPIIVDFEMAPCS